MRAVPGTFPRRAAHVLFAALLSACGRNDAPTAGPAPTVASLSLHAASLTLHGIGDSATAGVATVDPRGRATTSPVELRWTSSDTSVVRVAAASGRVATIVSVGDGDARVTVAGYNLTANVEVHVLAAVRRLSIVSTPSEIALGDEVALAADVDADLGVPRTVTWSSSAPDVVTVDATGRLVARGVGSAMVTAQSTHDPNVVAQLPVAVSVRYKWATVDLGMYQADQDPRTLGPVPEAQIRERIERVRPYANGIRVYSMAWGLEVSGRIAHEMGMTAACQAWVGRDRTQNDLEIRNTIAAARAGECDRVMVGSEVLLRGDIPEQELVAQIRRVRQQVPSTIPVSYVDVPDSLLAHPAVIDAVDDVMVNVWTFWEGVSHRYAIARLHAVVRQVQAAARGKRVIVAETGWPTQGGLWGDADASLANAVSYNQAVRAWSRATGVETYLFQPMDEPWKLLIEDPVFAGYYGVMDAYGLLKPGMTALFDGSDRNVPDTWSDDRPVGGPGTPEIELADVPPLGTRGRLTGIVRHAVPMSHRVLVAIKVNGFWWGKPYVDKRRHLEIWPDGVWQAEIGNAPGDEAATEVRAYLVPATYTGPMILGLPEIPAALEAAAVAKAAVARVSAVAVR